MSTTLFHLQTHSCPGGAPIRRVVGRASIAAIAAAVLLASPVVAASSNATATVDETRTYAEEVVSTCTTLDHASRCRDWATGDVPAWARGYGNRTADWLHRSRDNATSWGRAYVDAVRAWAEGSPERVPRYAGEIAGWAQAYADDVEDWSSNLTSELPDWEGCVIFQEGDGECDPSIWPDGLEPSDVPRPDPPTPAGPAPPESPELTPGLPPWTLPPTPDAPPSPDGSGSDALEAPQIPAGSTAPTARLAATSSTSRAEDTGTPRSADSLGEGSVPIARDSGGFLAALVVAALLASFSGAVKLVRLYRRIDREDALDHDLRQAMIDLVREDPATNVSQLAAALDVARTTVRYHVRVLEEVGLLESRRVGQEKIFYVRGEHPPEDKDALVAVRDPTRRDLLDVLVRSPGLSLAEIGRRLGRDRSTIKHHVDALVELDLVADRREGRCRLATVRDEVRDAVRRALGRSGV